MPNVRHHLAAGLTCIKIEILEVAAQVNGGVRHHVAGRIRQGIQKSIFSQPPCDNPQIG